MRCSRRLALASLSAAAGAAMLRFPAGAAEFTYKWAHNWPPDHPFGLRIAEAAQKTLQDSGGRLEIRVFPSSQLGGANATINQTKVGAIEINTALYAELGGMVPASNLTGLPFAFADHKQAWTACDGAFGSAVRTAVEANGFFVFPRIWDGGFREISNNVRPIRTPEDLSGLKIRVPPSPVMVAMFKALGTSPVSVEPASMYVACQTHIVDGTELPVSTIDGFKMYEVLKYLSIVNQAWTPNVVLMNPDARTRLPNNLQAILDRSVDASGVREREDMVKLDATVEQTLVSKGMVANHPNIAAFKTTVHASGLYAQWRTQYGAAAFDLLERAVGRLA